LNLSFFITPHGFGHAARACAVMAALLQRRPALHFEIYTQTPRWFFDDSLAGPFTCHSLLADVGLAQVSPLVEDLPETIRRLDEFAPFPPARVAGLAAQLRSQRCALVLCDISPLGIAAARAASLPSVLIENFTWDWIYEGYAAEAPALRPHIDYLREIFASADYHIQAAPVCAPHPAAYVVSPISRQPRAPRERIREHLGLPPEATAVLVSMGGIQSRYHFLDRLAEQGDIFFVVPGGSEADERRGNAVLLPHHTPFFYPDLLNACDAVVGKVGYSTVAEAYHAGLPYGCVTRARFRESEVLTQFVRDQMRGLEIRPEQFESGDWLARLPDLLALPRLERQEPNGAEQAAELIADLLAGYTA